MFLYLIIITMNKIIDSPKIQSLKHAILWWSIYWAWVAIHQALYSQLIIDIIYSSWWQFLTSSLNWYINLRIYNQLKKKLYEFWLDQKRAIIWWALTSWLETFLVVFTTQSLLWSKNPISIAITYSAITTFMLPTIYENKFISEKKIIKI